VFSCSGHLKGRDKVQGSNTLRGHIQMFERDLTRKTPSWLEPMGDLIIDRIFCTFDNFFHASFN